MNTTDLEVLSTMAEEGKLKPVVLSSILSLVCIRERFIENKKKKTKHVSFR